MKRKFSGQRAQSYPNWGQVGREGQEAVPLPCNLLVLIGWGLLPGPWALQCFWSAFLESWAPSPARLKPSARVAGIGNTQPSCLGLMPWHMGMTVLKLLKIWGGPIFFPGPLVTRLFFNNQKSLICSNIWYCTLILSQTLAGAGLSLGTNRKVIWLRFFPNHSFSSFTTCSFQFLQGCSGRERGRHRIRNRLQVPSCQHTAWHVAWTHEPWDHDLSQSRMLNRLSHPGTPQGYNLNGLITRCFSSAKLKLWDIIIGRVKEQLYSLSQQQVFIPGKFCITSTFP